MRHLQELKHSFNFILHKANYTYTDNRKTTETISPHFCLVTTETAGACCLGTPDYFPSFVNRRAPWGIHWWHRVTGRQTYRGPRVVSLFADRSLAGELSLSLSGSLTHLPWCYFCSCLRVKVTNLFFSDLGPFPSQKWVMVTKIHP